MNYEGACDRCDGSGWIERNPVPCTCDAARYREHAAPGAQPQEITLHCEDCGVEVAEPGACPAHPDAAAECRGGPAPFGGAQPQGGGAARLGDVRVSAATDDYIVGGHMVSADGLLSLTRKSIAEADARAEKAGARVAQLEAALRTIMAIVESAGDCARWSGAEVEIHTRAKALLGGGK